MANKIGAIRYIECSALTKDGVRKVFEVCFGPNSLIHQRSDKKIIIEF